MQTMCTTKKYGFRDYRGGGALQQERQRCEWPGRLQKKISERSRGIEIQGHLSKLGPIATDRGCLTGIKCTRMPFFCPDATLLPTLREYMDALRKEGNSIGAEVTVVIRMCLQAWESPSLIDLMQSWPTH